MSIIEKLQIEKLDFNSSVSSAGSSRSTSIWVSKSSQREQVLGFPGFLTTGTWPVAGNDLDCRQDGGRETNSLQLLEWCVYC